MSDWRARLEPVIRPVMQAHWRRVRGMTLGVRGLALDGQGRICLIRHTYMTGWYLPGGGVERGETLRETITREMREEAGVKLTAAPQLFQIYANEVKFRGDHVALYVIREWEPCKPEPGQEIAECGWFAPDNLPGGTSPATRLRIREVLNGLDPAEIW